MNKNRQIYFAHMCSLLLESGISLSESLSILESMEKSKRVRTQLLTIRKKVEQGTLLSKSILSVEPKFNRILISTISYGEASGILSSSLKQGKEILEAGNVMRSKIINALVYPSFIGVATIGMTLFLVMFIFPKIIPLFASMNIELPIITRLVQMLYELLQKFGLLVLCLVISSALIIFIAYRKKVRFRNFTQKYLLQTPFVGSLLKKYTLAIQCKSISTLLECGQALPIILEHISNSSSLEPYRRAWVSIQKETIRGASLASSLRPFGHIYPSLIPDMVAIGEKTGLLSNAFKHVSIIYENEIETTVRRLSTSLEPVLMIGMGIVVGSVALSIILPIYEITNHLTK